MIIKKEYKYLFFLFAFIFCEIGNSQTQIKTIENQNTTQGLDSLIANEEIIDLGENPVYTIDLKNKDNKAYYKRLSYKLVKPYNYAREITLIYNQLNDSLKLIKKKSARNKFIKQSKKEIDNEFRKTFIKMTRWQGEIFIKLMHRNTGKTIAEIIKEHRGKMALFIFQTKAGLFNLNLDTAFSPSEVREDKFIQTAISNLITKGRIKPVLLGDKPKYKLGKENVK